MPIVPTNGMTAAASALRYWERRQEVVSNNLANVSTTGFKGERVFGRGVGDAITVAQTATDRRAGTRETTGRPLDVALEGADTFVVVKTPHGERLARGGSFNTDADGRVVDADGNALLGERGPIMLPAGMPAIDPTGLVMVDGKPVEKLRLERVPADVSLQHEGGTLFLPPANRRVVEDGARVVHAGALEDSNVSSIDSLVDLISIQRAYASTEKAISSLDEVRRTATTDLGKPA